jgi:hypothetical protein
MTQSDYAHTFFDTWTTFDGVSKKINEIDNQHLSNILWFNEVFHNRNRYNCSVQFQLGVELAARMKNESRLDWKPLPIPDEIKSLVEMGLVRENGDIMGNAATTINAGKKIGAITHIENWQSFLV